MFLRWHIPMRPKLPEDDFNENILDDELYCTAMKAVFVFSACREIRSCLTEAHGAGSGHSFANIMDLALSRLVAVALVTRGLVLPLSPCTFFTFFSYGMIKTGICLIYTSAAFCSLTIEMTMQTRATKYILFMIHC